ncbi:MAG: hypothetical protein ACKESB_00835 [Candidatus Hodgkinia cicadicola]
MKVVSCTKLISSASGCRLSEAKTVVAGGNSFGSAETFSQYLVPLAAKLNAAVGGREPQLSGRLVRLTRL